MMISACRHGQISGGGLPTVRHEHRVRPSQFYHTMSSACRGDRRAVTHAAGRQVPVDFRIEVRDDFAVKRAGRPPGDPHRWLGKSTILRSLPPAPRCTRLADPVSSETTASGCSTCRNMRESVIEHFVGKRHVLGVSGEQRRSTRVATAPERARRARRRCIDQQHVRRASCACRRCDVEHQASLWTGISIRRGERSDSTRKVHVAHLRKSRTSPAL